MLAPTRSPSRAAVRLPLRHSERSKRAGGTLRSRTSQNVQQIARFGEQNAIAFWNLAGAAKPLYNGVRNNGQSRTPVPTGWDTTALCGGMPNKRAFNARPYKVAISCGYAP